MNTFELETRVNEKCAQAQAQASEFEKTELYASEYASCKKFGSGIWKTDSHARMFALSSCVKNNQQLRK